MTIEEGSPTQLGKRTLAIVVARCSRLEAGAGVRAERQESVQRRPIRPLQFGGTADRQGHCIGSAAVLYRQLHLVEALAPERVLVIESDAVRGIDYSALIDTHVASGIGATLAVAEVPADLEGAFCDVTLDSTGRALRLSERGPHTRIARPGEPARLICAGAYVIDRELLCDCLEVDAAEPTSTHDFRADVLPLLMRANGVAAHRARVIDRQLQPAAALSAERVSDRAGGDSPETGKPGRAAS